MEVSNTKQNSSSGLGRKVSGSAIGLAAAGVAHTSMIPLAYGFMKKIQKLNNLPADQVNLLQNAANQALKDTGLAAKGVSIVRLKPPKTNLGLKAIFTNTTQEIKQGMNAGYDWNFKQILLPHKGMNTQTFHEIGHALNSNCSTIGKMLGKIGFIASPVAIFLILFGALTSNSKPKENKELTPAQKTKNFIRNNIGKLTLAAMLPQLLEEGLASIKGQKLANKLLSPQLAKTVAKGNAIGYLTYILTALGTGLAATIGVKVKDAIVENKKSKQQTNV